MVNSVVTMKKGTDKSLLLLGILRHQKRHAYALNELLKMPGYSIRIGRGNAYQLLEKLERDGFITSAETKKGRRPVRRVYRITAAGEEAFDNMLRDRLARFTPTQHPDGVSLNFLDSLPWSEVLPLLEARLEGLADHRAELDMLYQDVRADHPGLDYLMRQTAFENGYLIDLIERLRRKDIRRKEEDRRALRLPFDQNFMGEGEVAT